MPIFRLSSLILFCLIGTSNVWAQSEADEILSKLDQNYYYPQHDNGLEKVTARVQREQLDIASGGHHSHHQAKVVSPFGKVSSDKSLHCLLNAHMHQAKLDCPHKENHSKSTEFRADCGSHPGASNSKGFSFENDLSRFDKSDAFAHNLVSYPFYIPIDFKVRFLPHTIEHPPQTFLKLS
jgi:hypothetical protein